MEAGKMDRVKNLCDIELSQVEVDDQNTSIQWNDLPDPALLSVFAYLEIGDLLSVSNTCKQWRKLVKTISLWQNKHLTFCPEDIWEDEENAALRFSHILMFAPKLYSLELSLQDDIPQPVEEALRLSDCLIRSVVLKVVEYNSVAEAFLLKHREIAELSLVDYCSSGVWAQRMCRAISGMGLSCLNLSNSQLLHHVGIRFKDLVLKRLEYCPLELVDEIAEPGMVLADIICSSQDNLSVVKLRVPYSEVFSALKCCSNLREVDISYGEDMEEFLKAAARMSNLKNICLNNLPDDNVCVFEMLSTFNHLENLYLYNCLNFPSFSAMLPMLLSLKTLVLSEVNYVGATEFKNLMSIKSLNLKITVHNSLCSSSGDYWLCRDRIISKFNDSNVEISVETLDMDSNYDYGYKPVKSCYCSQKKPH